MRDEYNDIITVSDIREHFLYEDGNLLWKKKPSRKCPSIKLNTPAGYLAADGYIVVGFRNKDYKLHNLIYCYFFGIFPEFVDHRDGNPLNNNINNLRPASRTQNAQNTKLFINNTSGVKGVNYQNGKWRVRLQEGNKRMSLGTYDTLELAQEVAKEARNVHHGEFARE